VRLPVPPSASARASRQNLGDAVPLNVL